MRLLLISNEFPPGPGGIGSHAYHVVSQLQRQGWEIAVVTSQDYATAKEVRDFNQAQSFPIVSLHRFPGAFFEALYRASVIFTWMFRWQPEIILATGLNSVWLTSWLARGHHVPWVAIGHGA